MLPPFRIRNLRLPSLPQDNLVQINAPRYEAIISSHPAAALKYYDEDDKDLITLGSSRELAEKLQEPLAQQLQGAPADPRHHLPLLEYHEFEINDRDHVRKLWQSMIESENTPVAQDQANIVKWSAEKKNRLAIYYEMRRAEIWNPIAEELGVTWQCVEAMHWALGKEEMTRRAYELGHSAQQSESTEEVAQRMPDSTYLTPDTQLFEDHRVLHFNATRPPQVQLQMPLTHQQPVKATAWQPNNPKVSMVDLNLSASSTMGKHGEASSKKEEKKQAQVVGENLRSRMTVDNHQKRWANCKSSTSAFLPKTSSSVSLGPGLTSEGKIQAQVAGHRLRCRTNPIRHSRPEHGISKNRWSSYSGTRPTRFDECKSAQDEAGETSETADIEEKVPKNSQPSLLEVFEAELAKEISVPHSEEASQLAPPVLQAPFPQFALHIDASKESQDQPLPQGPPAILGHVKEQSHEPTARNAALSRELFTAIDHGIRGLNSCIQSIAWGLQEVSSVSRQVADATRNVESQLIDDAFLRFRSLTAGFAAALERDIAAHGPETTIVLSMPSKEAETDIDTFPPSISDNNDLEEDAIIAHKSNLSLLNGADDLSKMVLNPGSKHASVPRSMSAEPANPPLEVRSQPSPGPAMGEEPRFRSTHLLRHPKHVERLQQSQSTEVFEQKSDFQRAISPHLKIHFPTLPQLKGENFGATRDFPALPGMEPLIPQRAYHQQIYETKAGECGPPKCDLTFEGRSNRADASCGYQSLVADRQEHWVPRNEHGKKPLSLAARLSGPFDSLEAEPSAQSRLTEGLRRNATIATTGIRNAERCRRPYSEVFDDMGRVPWGETLRDDRCEGSCLYRPSGDRARPLDVDQEHNKMFLQLDRKSRRSPLAVARYDDQHHDDSTVGRINDCVEQLVDLGFGGKDNVSAGRLLVYAQAAAGVLGDAIDLIDEEQQAWQRL